MAWGNWSRRDPLGLATFVTPDARRYLSLGLSRVDIARDRDEHRRLVEAIYAALLTKHIRYATEEYHPSAVLQPIRTPFEILDVPREGTCLDLATLFCGLCLANELLPLLIVTEGHALAAVSLTHGLRAWDDNRPGRSLFETGPLTDPAPLIALIDRGDFLAIECTGVARSETLGQVHHESLSPEWRGRENGVLPWARAIAAGREQLSHPTRSFRFALDIAVAHYGWRIEPHALDERRYGVRSGIQDDEPVVRLSPPATSNIPNPVTRFIGRERELADIHRLVTDHRLVTLAGAGGSGKTRLAIEVGREHVGRVRHGVWLVDLATLTEPDLIPGAIAETFGLRVEPSQPPIAAIEQYIKPREVLLILDNCEHLVDVVARLVGHLLEACEGLRVLATSREPLDVDGESVYRVPTLTLPAIDHAGDVSVIAQADAVRFFVARARLVAADFTLRSENAELVAELCTRLDGIPLALELAAARLTVLSLEQIVARLADRFRLLTSGSRTVLPRQQTLLAMLDWSYGLLTEPERLLLRRLSIFAAGATLDALAAVCVDDGIDEYDTLDLVTGLVDKSLSVTDERHGEVRYRLLESIREYARDKLVASDEMDRTQAGFAQWCVGFARDRNDDLRGAGQKRTLDRLEMEHDNLRAALRWLLEHDPETAAQLTVSLYWFWHVHSHVNEGLQWLNRVLDTTEALSPTSRAKALNGLAALATDKGDFADAVSYLEGSLVLLGHEDPTERATVHLHLGTALRVQGDYSSATEHWHESMRLFQLQGDDWGRAYVLNGLGILAALDQNFEQACKSFDDSLKLRRAIGDEYGIAESLSNMGLALRYLGRFEQADAVLQECVNRFEMLQFATGVATAVNNRGWLALDQGDHQRAATQFHESLALTHEIGPLYLVAESLEGLASVAVVQELFERAACLLSSADRVYTSLGVVATPDERAQFEGHLTTIKEHLAPDEFARLWKTCQELQLAQVVEGLTESSVD